MCGGSGGNSGGGGESGEGGSSTGNAIQDNLASGNLQRSQVIEAVKLMHSQATEAKNRGDYATAKDLMFKASDLSTAAKIKPHELLPGKDNTPRNVPRRNALPNERRLTAAEGMGSPYAKFGSPEAQRMNRYDEEHGGRGPAQKESNFARRMRLMREGKI